MKIRSVFDARKSLPFGNNAPDVVHSSNRRLPAPVIPTRGSVCEKPITSGFRQSLCVNGSTNIRIGCTTFFLLLGNCVGAGVQLSGLEFDLKRTVFGQPIALDIVLGAMKQHLNTKKTPERALMLSFHGWPGTGKNFVSQKILKNMFRNGPKTKYVHFFRGSIDFPSKSNTETYKKIIAEKVKEEVLECHRSIFVFDEVEKMPPGILHVLSAFVKTGSYGDYDFRRVIFILLSNTGGEVILQEILKSYKQGLSREDLNERRFQKVLAEAAFNLDGGLQYSGLIKDYGISHFVPFLPLEKKHVVQCLEKVVEDNEQILSEELVQQVLQELTFGPPSLPIYTYAGCKGIAEKAAFLFERESRRRRSL